VLELDVHPHPKLLDIEPRCHPVNADLPAGRTGLLSHKVGATAQANELALSARALSDLRHLRPSR
jgi:hypothetical protein